MARYDVAPSEAPTGGGSLRWNKVESRSIDYVPLSERHGRLTDQFTIWFAGSAMLLSLATGVIGIGLGLNLIWTLIALAVGTFLGTLPVAAHASQGPHLGLPQMIQSRPQFGRYGALFIWVVAFAVYWGYVVLDVNLFGPTATQVVGGSRPVWAIVIGLISMVITIFGYHWMHAGQRWVTVVLVVVLAVYAVGILTGGKLPAGALSLSTGFQFAPFFMVMSAALAYQLSWAFFVSDYSRYMPPTTSHRAIIFFTASGAGLGVFSMEAVGAVGAALFPSESVTVALAESGDTVFNGLGTIVLLVGGLALVVFNAMCIYGGALTAITALDSLRPVAPTHRVRTGAIVAVGVTATLVGAFLPDDFIGTTFYTILAVLAYLMGPWTAINLTDYFLVRRGRYSITEIFNPNGMYGRWHAAGIVAYVLGFVVMVPFMYLSFYEGFAAKWLNDVDIAFFVGIPVAAIVYYALSRNLDLDNERAVIRQADAHLEELGEPIE
ncbi:MAG: cytosine permease [Nocardioides sp.]|nr:cytosine permease [Nocardioides sp.]